MGEEFLDELQVTFGRIQLDPERQAPVYQAVRHVLVDRFPFAVYDRMEPDRVVVIAVHHTSRDPGRWRSRA